MKSITKLCLTLIAAAALTSLPAGAQNASTNASTNTAPARAARTPGFRGKISAVDSATMTLTLAAARGGAETKVKIGSATKITKGREAATFADAAVGLNVNGQGKKGDDGVWTATTLRIAVPPAPKAAATPDTK
jgi:hypothetical protein